MLTLIKQISLRASILFQKTDINIPPPYKLLLPGSLLYITDYVFLQIFINSWPQVRNTRFQHNLTQYDFIHHSNVPGGDHMQKTDATDHSVT